jgi:hypothetical protein
MNTIYTEVGSLNTSANLLRAKERNHQYHLSVTGMIKPDYILKTLFITVGKREYQFKGTVDLCAIFNTALKFQFPLKVGIDSVAVRLSACV